MPPESRSTISLTTPTGRQIQARRLRQMPASPLRRPPTPPYGHLRHLDLNIFLLRFRLSLQSCQALLRQMRRYVQPEIFTPRRHRRGLLRQLLPQHPLPGVPGLDPGEVATEVRAPDLWVQGTCGECAGEVAGWGEEIDEEEAGDVDWGVCCGGRGGG